MAIGVLWGYARLCVGTARPKYKCQEGLSKVLRGHVFAVENGNRMFWHKAGLGSVAGAVPAKVWKNRVSNLHIWIGEERVGGVQAHKIASGFFCQH